LQGKRKEEQRAAVTHPGVAASDGVSGSESGQPSAREGEGNGVCFVSTELYLGFEFLGCGVDATGAATACWEWDGDTGGRRGGAACRPLGFSGEMRLM
jgi:hypothetical protein